MRLFFVIPCAVLSVCTIAQDTSAFRRPLFRSEVSTDLWLAYNLQGNWSDETGETTLKYLEIGIGKGRYIHHMHGVAGAGIYASQEILLNSNKRIFGTKLGCFMHSLAGFGFSIVYYTDFKKGNLKLRPELGFGMGRFGFLAGYNIPTFRNKSFPELQRQTDSLQSGQALASKRKKLRSTN